MAGEKPETPGGRNRRLLRNLGVAINAVGTFATGAVGGFFAGYFLDKWWHTTPLVTLVGSFLGMAGGAYLVIIETRRIFK